jgi:hypothetical protein
MPRNIIFVLLYHRHKLLDLIYRTDALQFMGRQHSVIYCAGSIGTLGAGLCYVLWQSHNWVLKPVDQFYPTCYELYVFGGHSSVTVHNFLQLLITA